jgi:outer membrane protein assembly factor BamB
VVRPEDRPRPPFHPLTNLPSHTPPPPSHPASWSTPLGQPIAVTPVLDDTESVLFVASSGSVSAGGGGDGGGSVWALNATDGTPLWDTPWLVPSPSPATAAPPIVADLRYVHPGLLVVTASATNANPFFVLNVTAVVAEEGRRNGTSSSPSSSSSTTVDDVEAAPPTVMWSCTTPSVVRQPVAMWSPWRTVFAPGGGPPSSTLPSSLSSTPFPGDPEWLGWGQAYAVSDDGTVYGFDLDDPSPMGCPTVASPSRTGTPSPVVPCEACAAWSLQRGNRLLGRVTSAPMLNIITTKDVSGALDGLPASSLSNASVVGIVSARLVIATAESGGYSGGLYSFNVTAGGLPPLATYQTIASDLFDAARAAGPAPTDGSGASDHIPPPLPPPPPLPYSPTLVRDSKQLLFSITGVSFPVTPAPFLAFRDGQGTPGAPAPLAPSSSSTSSSSSSYGEWLIVGTALGEVVCLDLTNTSEVAPPLTSAVLDRRTPAPFTGSRALTPSLLLLPPTSPTPLSLSRSATVVWWSRVPPASNPSPATAGPVTDGVAVLLAFGDGTVANLDVRTGAPRWMGSTASGAPVPASRGGLIVDASGRVYAATANGVLVALDSTCPTSAVRVLYLSIAIGGSLFLAAVLLFHCAKAFRGRWRARRAGPTQAFVDSVLRAAATVPLFSRRVAASMFGPASRGGDARAFIELGSLRPSSSSGPRGERRSRAGTADSSSAGASLRRGSTAALLELTSTRRSSVSGGAEAEAEAEVEVEGQGEGGRAARGAHDVALAPGTSGAYSSDAGFAARIAAVIKGGGSGVEGAGGASSSSGRTTPRGGGPSPSPQPARSRASTGGSVGGFAFPRPQREAVGDAGGRAESSTLPGRRGGPAPSAPFSSGFSVIGGGGGGGSGLGVTLEDLDHITVDEVLTPRASLGDPSTGAIGRHFAAARTARAGGSGMPASAAAPRGAGGPGAVSAAAATPAFEPRLQNARSPSPAAALLAAAVERLRLMSPGRLAVHAGDGVAAAAAAGPLSSTSSKGSAAGSRARSRAGTGTRAAAEGGEGGERGVVDGRGLLGAGDGDGTERAADWR